MSSTVGEALDLEVLAGGDAEDVAQLSEAAVLAGVSRGALLCPARASWHSRQALATTYLVREHSWPQVLQRQLELPTAVVLQNDSDGDGGVRPNGVVRGHGEEASSAGVGA